MTSKKDIKARSNTKGLIFNIQKFSFHDGPGIRTTVFMKGCPLQCKWCSNPESQEILPEIMITEKACIKCGTCLELCKRGAIKQNKSGRHIDRALCDLCMKCALACPAQSLEIMGKFMDVSEVIEEIKQDEIFYHHSEGGVTISGGEPMLQWEFVCDLLKECKKNNFHTALDTCGYTSWAILEKVLKYVDLVLYDIKLMDSRKHKEATGVTNEIILKNAVKVTNTKRTWLRYGVIPNFNDSESCAEQIAIFSSKLPFEKVSLLPYHAFGIKKYERLGRPYLMEEIFSPSEGTMEHVAAIFKSFGMEVTIGY